MCSTDFHFLFFIFIGSMTKSIQNGCCGLEMKVPSGCCILVAGGMCWHVDVVLPDLSRFFETGF